MIVYVYVEYRQHPDLLCKCFYLDVAFLLRDIECFMQHETFKISIVAVFFSHHQQMANNFFQQVFDVVNADFWMLRMLTSYIIVDAIFGYCIDCPMGDAPSDVGP